MMIQVLAEVRHRSPTAETNSLITMQGWPNERRGRFAQLFAQTKVALSINRVVTALLRVMDRLDRRDDAHSLRFESELVRQLYFELIDSRRIQCDGYDPSLDRGFQPA